MPFPVRDITAFFTLIMFSVLVAFLSDWAVLSGF